MKEEIKNALVKLVEKVMIGETQSVKEYKHNGKDALFLQRTNRGNTYGVTVMLETDRPEYAWVSNHRGKTERSEVLLSNPFQIAAYVPDYVVEKEVV